jgi:orotate phosphoribosyltransferase-like protein
MKRVSLTRTGDYLSTMPLSRLGKADRVPFSVASKTFALFPFSPLSSIKNATSKTTRDWRIGHSRLADAPYRLSAISRIRCCVRLASTVSLSSEILGIERGVPAIS